MYLVTPAWPSTLASHLPAPSAFSYIDLIHLHITNSHIPIDLLTSYWGDEHSFVNNTSPDMAAASLCPNLRTLVWEWQPILWSPPVKLVALTVLLLSTAESLRRLKIKGLYVDPWGCHFVSEKHAWLRQMMSYTDMKALEILEFDMCNQTAVHFFLSCHSFPQLKALIIDGEAKNYAEYGANFVCLSEQNRQRLTHILAVVEIQATHSIPVFRSFI